MKYRPTTRLAKRCLKVQADIISKFSYALRHAPKLAYQILLAAATQPPILVPLESSVPGPAEYLTPQRTVADAKTMLEAMAQVAQVAGLAAEAHF